jgi:Fur family peroxide stress response transcriptional regulator
MTGVRRSRKRDAILQALRSTTSHPNAEWIYAKVKGEIPDLSLGTVYRNLSLFLQEGEAMRVTTVGGQDRFDGDTRPHAHFICRGCGAVLDVENAPKVGVPEVDALVEGYELNYHGLCRNCCDSQSR